MSCLVAARGFLCISKPTLIPWELVLQLKFVLCDWPYKFCFGLYRQLHRFSIHFISFSVTAIASSSQVVLALRWKEQSSKLPTDAIKYLGWVPVLVFFFVFALTCLLNWSAYLCCVFMGCRNLGWKLCDRVVWAAQCWLMGLLEIPSRFKWICEQGGQFEDTANP